MEYEKTMVCLANSRKPPSGRCVAGREFVLGTFGPWIRPVSARPGREVSLEERRFENGRECAVLDVMSVPFTRPEPERYQTENHLIDPDRCWRRLGVASWALLQAAVEDSAAPLWINGHSSAHGKNDRVPESDASGLTTSLRLVRPDGLRLVVAPEGVGLGVSRRRVRAHFELGARGYCVVVTDPRTEAAFLRRKDGAYPLAAALICMSLGEAFHGYAYKLAAAIITRSGSAS